MRTFYALLLLTCLATPAFGADYAEEVDRLIPGLAAEDVASRYAVQMELQDLASQSSTPGRESDRRALATVLAARAADDAVAQPARVWMVRQLEYIGATEAVPALTGLLNEEDQELRECARRALEKTPLASGANQSLRDCLVEGGTTRWQIGLINSLGQRQDPASIEVIKSGLNDPPTATPAALALAKIACPLAKGGVVRIEALDALSAKMNDVPAAAQGLIEAAHRLEKGNSATARAIYRDVYEQSTFAPAQAAALVGLFHVDPAGSNTRLAKVLTGTDPKLRHAAVSAIKEAPSRFVPLVVTLFPRLSPAVKVQIVSLMDPSAERTLIDATSDVNEEVRRMAVQRLGVVGTAASVPALLQIATSEDRAARATASDTLARMPGSGPTAALKAAAMKESSEKRAVAIRTLATRKDTSVVPLLIACAKESNEVVSRAALQALGKLGGDEEVVPVARIALSSPSDAATSALESIARRVEDRVTAAEVLLSLTVDNPPARLALLDVLGILGGPEAMRVISQTLSTDQAERGIRALSDWPDLGAVRPLLELASDPDTPAKQRKLALQGVVRLLISAEDEPVKRRAKVVLAAWATAQDDDEKRLVLSAMGTVPHAEVAAALKPKLADPELQAEAAVAGVALAEELVKSDKASAMELAEAILVIDPPRTVERRARKILGR